VEHIQNPPQRKSKPKRLGKMSRRSWDRAAQIISDVLADRFSVFQTVQVLTLNSSSVNCAGVLDLLSKFVKGVSAFGIHELSAHYGEATDEDLYPQFQNHMRLIVWSEDPDSVVEFCAVFAALIGDPDDRLFNLPVCRTLPVTQAIDWISEYARSPVSNYEGDCDPEIRYESKPASARYGMDDIYKSPCYRWGEKRSELDRRTAQKRLGDFILAHGEGAAIKDVSLQHPRWP
jgi:hypothetical protein